MKRIPKTLTHLFIALVFTVALSLAGCSASTVSGPDLDRQDPQTVQPDAPNADNNGGGYKHGGGGGGSNPTGAGNNDGGTNSTYQSGNNGGN